MEQVGRSQRRQGHSALERALAKRHRPREFNFNIHRLLARSGQQQPNRPWLLA
jgi:hypothetical protein